MKKLMCSINSVSVIIPVTERGEEFLELLGAYLDNINKVNIDFEFIIVFTPGFLKIADELKEKFSNDDALKIILLNRNYGEAGVLNIGLDHAKYDLIMTLPSYEQVSPTAIPKIIGAFKDTDALVINRWPRIDPIVNRLQSALFKSALKMLSYSVPKDSGSGIRLAKREVFESIRFYGDMHRFFKLLVEQAGFQLIDLDIPQSQKDAHPRVYTPRTYISRALDILTIGFLTRFSKKPLRFFGASGAFSAIIGLLGLGYIAFERLFLGVSAADRPILILFSLFLILGIQLVAIGLVGEIVIFTSSKDNKEYRIKKIIN